MLVIQGYFENGVFVPDVPLANVKGRRQATLTIIPNEQKEQKEQAEAWKQFGKAVLQSDEKLDGEPERLRFRELQ